MPSFCFRSLDVLTPRPPFQRAFFPPTCMQIHAHMHTRTLTYTLTHLHPHTHTHTDTNDIDPWSLRLEHTCAASTYKAGKPSCKLHLVVHIPCYPARAHVAYVVRNHLSPPLMKIKNSPRLAFNQRKPRVIQSWSAGRGKAHRRYRAGKVLCFNEPAWSKTLWYNDAITSTIDIRAIYSF